MSFRCKIFGHKWKYSVEDVTYIISNSVTKSTPKGIESTWPMDVRICLRCYYKQLNHQADWSECKLTKQELRDKNLNQLGI